MAIVVAAWSTARLRPQRLLIYFAYGLFCVPHVARMRSEHKLQSVKAAATTVQGACQTVTTNSGSGNISHFCQPHRGAMRNLWKERHEVGLPRALSLDTENSAAENLLSLIQ
jgi:hypothetical protein